MNLKRCNNGHFYDEDKFISCPHCVPTMSANNVTVAVDLDNAPGIVLPGVFDSEDIKTTPLDLAIENANKVEPEEEMRDDQKTVSFYSDAIGVEPVVGWMICTKGEAYGESFPLKTGRNYIGRSSEMDIALIGEMSVARVRHATIIYEPKSRLFIAQAGESRELFYLNDKVVLSNEVLKPYDVLQIGNAVFSFIPFCGPQFGWEDTQEQEKKEEKIS